MNNITFQPNTSELETDAALMSTLNKFYDDITQMAPSDSVLNITLGRYASEFIATVKLASMNLKFTLDATAKSPFMALEKVAAEAKDKIEFWKISRNN